MILPIAALGGAQPAARSWTGPRPWLAPALLGLAAATAPAQVPPPAAVPANIIVSGRTSTAVDIKIAKVGQEIPRTYAGERVANTPGFDFYVSEHFALKSNMDEAFSRHILEISELAHPHWVALIGAQPPDPQTRMLITFANNVENLRKAMVSDLGQGPAGGFAGGFTAYVNRSAYNYPSGTLTYHKRALVIHENLHMLNLVCNGTGGTEGPTYAGEQHVYDPARRQLTVCCFDKAPVNNYTDTGLDELRRQFVAVQDVVRKHWYGGHGRGAVYQQFLLTDPDRMLKWRVWRDEFYAGQITSENSLQYLERIFGPLDKFNDDWFRWTRARRASFHHVDWGWEQDGNELWAYGWPWDAKYWSQMNLQYAPSEQVVSEPLRMDYPAAPRPSIVGPVQRGVEEPTVAFVVSGVGGKAWGGFGLGVEQRDMCQVVIVGNQTLVVDGQALGIARKEFPLNANVKAAASKSGGRFGVTLTIKRNELAVAVRAGGEDAIEEMSVAVPLEAASRERLINKPMAIIGKDGYPRVTPWIDDARNSTPDPGQAAPANRWRFAGLEQLETLYRAAWRLGESAPESLLALKIQMLKAVDAPSETQRRAIDSYDQQLDRLVQDIRNCPADDAVKARALADLAGLFLQTESPSPGSAPDRVVLKARVTGRLQDPVHCALRAVALDRREGRAQTDTHRLQTLRPQWFTVEVPVSTDEVPVRIKSTVNIQWRGAQIPVDFEHSVGGTSIPHWLVLGPFDGREPKADADVREVETARFDPDRTYASKAGDVMWRRAERPNDLSIASEYVIDFNRLWGMHQQAAAYALVWIDAAQTQDALLSLGSDDGVIVRLNGHEIHRNLVDRPFTSRSDKVPIKLKQGRNILLVRVTQGTGDWQFAAQLTTPAGLPLRDVTTSIAPVVPAAAPPRGDDRQ